MGDLGSKVLKKMPTGVVWKAGALAEVSFYIKTNHGGGYQFRLCPLEEELTEACFQRTPVAFASPTQVLKRFWLRQRYGGPGLISWTTCHP